MLDHRKQKRLENKITSNHQKSNLKNNLGHYNYSNNKQDFLKSGGNIEIDGTSGTYEKKVKYIVTIDFPL